MRKLIYLLSILIIFQSGNVPAGEVGKEVVKEGVRAAFEEFERQMIYKYFDEHVYHHEHEYEFEEPNHKKRGKPKGLPPGIAMKLERGGTLPPGIAKRYLPDDLKHRLPPPPDGYERTIVGNDVLLVDVDTGRIADIIADVIIGEP